MSVKKGVNSDHIAESKRRQKSAYDDYELVKFKTDNGFVYYDLKKKQTSKMS